MEDLEEFADERLYGRCFLCGDGLRTTESTKDHVPPQCWLGVPLPHNEPVVFACRRCNNDLSDDEAYTAAFLSAVLSGSFDAADQKLEIGTKVLSSDGRIRRKVKKSRCDVDGSYRWRPDHEIFETVVKKNARGHVFFELAEIRNQEPAFVNMFPISDAEPQDWADFLEPFDAPIWPEIGTRAYIRACTGADVDNGWVIVKPDVYRYRVTVDGLYVQSIWHNYLATEVLWAE